MNYRNCFVLLLFSFFNTGISRPKKLEKLTYMSLERPNVTYKNSDYIGSCKLTNKRYGRASPVYYIGLDFESLIPLDNKILIEYYFYEWLTFRYERSFVEMHFRWCNLLQKDRLFGSAFRQGKLALPCPQPAGFYSLSNMTILPDAIPRGFPFTKGRMFVNVTYAPLKELIASGFIDMELRTLKVEKKMLTEKL